MIKLKKIIAIVMLILLFFSSFRSIVYGAVMNDRVNIVKIGECDYTLQYKATNGGWSYVTCTVVGYYENGKYYPAYCLNRGNPRSRRM